MDTKIPEGKLVYRKAYIQVVEKDYSITSYGCFICQRNFLSPSEYDDHIASHGGDEDIPVSSQIEDENPTFTVTYTHCADASLLNFIISCNTDVSIEKIVIVRPEGRKQFHYIEKSKIQSSKENRTHNASVNCFLFDVAKEHSIFFVFRKYDETFTRHLEKYIFFRREQFPTNIALTSNIVPQHAKLQMVYGLPQNFPSQQVRSFSKVNYSDDDIIQSNSIMRQYLVEKKLTPSNYEEIICFLLQMEDHFIMSSYEKLNLTNQDIEALGSENYSFTLQHLKTNKVKQVLSEYDDIVLSTTTDTDDYYDDVFERDFKKPKKYFGCIYKLENNKVYFSLRGRTKIPVKNKYKIKIYPIRIPFRYQYAAIKRIKKCNYILKVLFPTENRNDQLSNISINFFNKSVENNPEQSQAVRNIVNGANNSIPYILFGPPGTGKSTTIIESVLQLWKTKPKSRILVTSGSNAACDEVAKRLCNFFLDKDGEGFNLLRIYAASREKRMDNTEEFLVEASNFAHGYHFYPSLDSIYLFRIVVATLTICGKLVQAAISDKHFTHIIIDECAASTESEALVGIAGLMGPDTKLILSGDPKQLGPVLKCVPAEKFGLGVSMMERLLSLECYAVNPETNEYDRSIQTILRRNFRTHKEILSISNELCYNSQLLACAKPELTNWVKGWKELPSKVCPMICHNVYGKTVKEHQGTSSMNSAEIEVVMEYVREILENGINGRKVLQNEIGIISPYKKQYSEIRKELDDKEWYNVETGSAETFQGQEKAIIIVSTVKSWQKHLGFLGNLKRLNVMLTRAQALLIIVGNPKSLQNDENWLHVLKYFQKKKAFKGKYFKLPNDTDPFNGDLLPDVPKNAKHFNNNRKQFKPRGAYQPKNVKGAAFNKNTSQGIKKQIVSETTGAPSRSMNPFNQNIPSSSNKYVQNTTTTKKPVPVPRQYNFAPKENKENRQQANVPTSTVIRDAPKPTTNYIHDRPTTSASLSSWPERRIYPTPSAPSYEELIPEYITEYREPPPSYESLRRDLSELNIGSYDFVKNHPKAYASQTKKKKNCIIL